MIAWIRYDLGNIARGNGTKRPPRWQHFFESESRDAFDPLIGESDIELDFAAWLISIRTGSTQHEYRIQFALKLVRRNKDGIRARRTQLFVGKRIERPAGYRLFSRFTQGNRDAVGKDDWEIGH